MKKFLLFGFGSLVLGSLLLGATSALAGANLSSISVGSQTGSLSSGVAGSTTYVVTVNRTGNGNLDVALSVTTALPTGATASFVPSTVSFTSNTPTSKTSTLTISTTVATPVQAGFLFTVQGVGDTTKTATGTLVIGSLTAQTITFGALANKIFGDADFGVSATATSGLSVSFASQTSSVCTVSGATVHLVTVGTCTVRASQAGNGSFSAAPNVDRFFTVADTTAPVIASHNDVTVEATSGSGAVVNYTSPDATDNVDATAPATCLPASGGTFTLGTNLVTCNKTDVAGNIAIPTTFNVIVVDTTDPEITVPTEVEIEAGEEGEVVVNYEASATDLVDGETEVSCEPASGSTFSVGTTEVTCTAVDEAGNESEASFDVIVSDVTGPTLVLSGNLTVEATGPSGAVVSFEATASDAVDGTVEVTCTPISGSMFALGETTVNCSASDLAEPANTSNGSFTVTVEDTTGPEITVPGDDVEVVSEDGEGVLVEYSVSATDLVDGEEVSLECTPASGSTFSVGTTEVVCTSTDQTGNSSEASFNVTVFDGNIPPDTTAPVITLNGSAVVEIDLGDEYNEQGATATDNVDTNVFVVITGDEAVDTETEGTYLVLYNATDSSENVAVEVVRTVIVSGSGNTSGSVPRGQVLGASTGNTGQVLGETKFNFTLPQKLGSRGNEVMELQKFLNNSGFGILVVDGKFGQKTKAALIKFQLANGLAGDGVVGPRTRAVLNK